MLPGLCPHYTLRTSDQQRWPMSTVQSSPSQTQGFVLSQNCRSACPTSSVHRSSALHIPMGQLRAPSWSCFFAEPSADYGLIYRRKGDRFQFQCPGTTHSPWFPPRRRSGCEELVKWAIYPASSPHQAHLATVTNACRCRQLVGGSYAV